MYRTIDTAIWHDPKFKNLPAPAKLFFFYLITNSHAHVSGIYYLPDVIILHETALKPKTIDTLWDTLSGAGLSRRDQESEVVWVRNMLKRQGVGEKNERAAANQLRSLHNCSLINDFLTHYPAIKRYYKHRVSNRVSRVGIQEQESKKGTNVPCSHKANGVKGTNQPREGKPGEEGKAPTPAQADPKATKPNGRVRRNPKAGDEPRPEHAALSEHFRARWKSLYRADYPWKFAKDGAHVKWILDECGRDLARAKAVVDAYVSDPDTFLAREHHPLGLLVSKFAKFVGEESSPSRVIDTDRIDGADEGEVFEMLGADVPVAPDADANGRHK